MQLIITYSRVVALLWFLFVLPVNGMSFWWGTFFLVSQAGLAGGLLIANATVLARVSVLIGTMVQVGGNYQGLSSVPSCPTVWDVSVN